MSDETSNSYRERFEQLQQSADAKSLKLCESMLKYALQDRKVQHVINSLRVYGWNINESIFFQCKLCSDGDNEREQGFHHSSHPFKYSETPQIILAANNLRIMENLDAFKQNLLHQLLLSFDHCRIDLDYNNCADISCTEIRASRLSGECGPFGSFGKLQVEEEMNKERNPLSLGWKSSKSMSGIGLRCIRKQSALNTDKFLNCHSQDGSGKKAWNAVNEAWTVCYRDFEPFRDRVDAW